MSTLFGCPTSDLPLEQFAVPIREGGLGINIETKEYSDEQYQTSYAIVNPLIQHILCKTAIPCGNHMKDLKKSLFGAKKGKWKNLRAEWSIANGSDFARRLEEKAAPGVGLWLHVMPVKWKHSIVFQRSIFRTH